jgi:hypothetical protein
MWCIAPILSSITIGQCILNQKIEPWVHSDWAYDLAPIVSHGVIRAQWQVGEVHAHGFDSVGDRHNPYV